MGDAYQEGKWNPLEPGLLSIIVYYHLTQKIDPFREIHEESKKDFLKEHGEEFFSLWQDNVDRELLVFIENHLTAWMPWRHKKFYRPDELQGGPPNLKKFLPEDPKIRTGILQVEKFVREDFKNCISAIELKTLVNRYSDAVKDATNRSDFFAFITRLIIEKLKSGELSKNELEIWARKEDLISPRAHVEALDFLLGILTKDAKRVADFLDTIVLEENFLGRIGLRQHKRAMEDKIIATQEFQKIINGFCEHMAIKIGGWTSDWDQEEHKGQAYLIVRKALQQYKERRAHVFGLIKTYLQRQGIKYFKSECGLPKEVEKIYICPICQYDCTEIAKERTEQGGAGLTCPRCGVPMHSNMMRQLVDGVYFLYPSDQLSPESDEAEEQEQYPRDSITQITPGTTREINEMIDRVSLEKLLSRAKLTAKQSMVLASDLDSDTRNMTDKEKARRLGLPTGNSVIQNRKDAIKNLKRALKRKK
jgi:hypothetical protein